MGPTEGLMLENKKNKNKNKKSLVKEIVNYKRIIQM